MTPEVPFISKNAISALVVDDNPMFLYLLKQLLEREPFIQIAGTAFTGEQAFQLARQLLPWVIVIDLEMQIFTNPHAIAYLRSRSPASTIVGLTMLDENISTHLRDKFGVDAIVAKSRAFADLMPAILDNMLLTLDALPRNQMVSQPV